jgi:glucose-1-phosphate adenylyltransferase
MDYRNILTTHVENEAALTVSTIPVPRADAAGLGIMQIDSSRRIVRFVEKPKTPEVLDPLRIPRESYADLGIAGDDELFLASMGIYVFNRDTLYKLLDNNFTDFGKHIIPQAIENERVFSSVFQGYWEDVGTIRSYFEANLDLVSELPRFNFFDMNAPIYTRPRFLPASKINGASIDHAIIADGCILNHCTISHSVVGIRTTVDAGSYLYRTVILGSDHYESKESVDLHAGKGLPRVGIGKNTRIENAIVDKGARIGDNCVITPRGKKGDVDHDLYFVRDGIVIIPKNQVIPHGTTI